MPIDLPAPPARSMTYIQYTVTLRVDDELRACIAECDGCQQSGVALWIHRRGERAREALGRRIGAILRGGQS